MIKWIFENPSVIGSIIFGIIFIGLLDVLKRRKKGGWKKSSNSNNNRTKSECFYEKADLFTPKEKRFFTALCELAEKYDLMALTKIRLADIVKPKSKENTSQWYTEFNKIKSKHIDFALIEKKTKLLVCLIELDDSTHYRENRVVRDHFVNNLFEEIDIKLIRTWESLKEVEEFIISKSSKTTV